MHTYGIELYLKKRRMRFGVTYTSQRINKRINFFVQAVKQWAASLHRPLVPHTNWDL